MAKSYIVATGTTLEGRITYEEVPSPEHLAKMIHFEETVLKDLFPDPIETDGFVFEGKDGDWCGTGTGRPELPDRMADPVEMDLGGAGLVGPEDFDPDNPLNPWIDAGVAIIEDGFHAVAYDPTSPLSPWLDDRSEVGVVIENGFLTDMGF